MREREGVVSVLTRVFQLLIFVAGLDDDGVFPLVVFQTPSRLFLLRELVEFGAGAEVEAEIVRRVGFVDVG